MAQNVSPNESEDVWVLAEEVTFSDMDNQILHSYEAVVDGLAVLIGEHCEIVLHSLEDLQHSAIRIANGNHTGRHVGAPITDFALKQLRKMSEMSNSEIKPYFTRAKSGDLMKSLTIPIRNQDRIIGLLCFNMNLDVPFSSLINSFIPPAMTEIPSDVNFASSIEELVMQTIEFTIEEVSGNSTIANNIKNRQIVVNLYEKGIFDIKDAINLVAERLDISKHTVYLYIRQLKSDE